MKKIYSIIAPLCLMGLAACASGSADQNTRDSFYNDSLEVEVIEENEAVEAPAAEEEVIEAVGVREVSDAEVKAFASRLKSNVKAGLWEDVAWYDDENYGICAVKVTNKNSFPIDGGDYYITYTYEYLYGEGMMKPEHHSQQGKSLPAGGSQKFKHEFTDDCGPTWVKVHFNLSDRQLYDKYSGL